MTNTISVFEPSAPYPTEKQQKRRTLDELKGKVVGFIDNSKPNFNYLVDDLADIMERRYGVKSTVKHQKRLPSIAASDEVMEDVVGKCDLVITGCGD